MSCSLSLHFPKALPPLFPSRCGTTASLFVASKHKSSHSTSIHAQQAEEPAFAVTGVNNEPELTWVLIQLGIVLFGYFIVVPPIIMNWLRIRWYKRNLLEMYFQFMFVFIFFPG